MKVLFALDNFSRGTGGAPASARELAAAITASGDSVDVIETGKKSGIANLNGASVRSVSLGGGLLSADRDLRTLVQNPRWRVFVAGAIAESHPDLVVTQGMLAPGAIEAARSAGVPVAYFFRGYAPLCPEQYIGLAPENCTRPECFRCLSWARRIKLPLVRRALQLYDQTVPRADLVVANSRYVAGLLERFWKVRAEVVYPTLNLAPAARPENDPAGFVLFVKPQAAKGLELFLALAAACPDRRFAVAGEIRGATADRLRKFPNVALLGWQNDMPAVYRRARAVLVPSQLPEPFGRVVAEAAALGCPVVASRIGGIPEAAGGGGIFIERSAGSEEWKRALASLDDPARYEPLRTAALESARRIAGEAGTQRLVSLLRSAAGNSGKKKPSPAPPGRKLSVVHIISALPLGGAELSVFHLTSRLSRELFDVRVICTREEGALAAQFREAGVPVELFKLPSRLGPGGLRRLAARLRELRADIVHTHMRRANTSGRLAAWLAGVPVILAHERNLPHEKKRRHFLTDRMLANITARVIAVSPQVAEAEAAGGGTPREKLLALPNALDLSQFRPGDRSPARAMLGLPQSDFIAGFAGRLHPVKNCDVLIRAAAEAAKQVPNLRLVLAGEGPERERLDALVAELGIAGRVTFLGARRDMPAVYPAFDILCLPSVTEGCSRVLLEAAACALPLVATPVGYGAEMVGSDEAGILVPVGEVAPLAAAMVRLAREPETRQKMGAAALRRAAGHGIGEYVTRMEELYLQLWAESGRK